MRTRSAAWLAAVAVAGIAACTAFTGESQPVSDAGAETGDPRDVSTPDGSDASDAAEAAAPCDVTSAFEIRGPVLAPGVADYDGQATLSQDELTLYFTGLVGVRLQLYFAGRASKNVQFTGATLIAELQASGASDKHPALSSDGRALYFSSTRETAPRFQLFRARRSSTGSPFGEIVALAGLGSAGNDVTPWISADDAELWFASDRDDAGIRRIYRALDRAPDGGLANPEPLTELVSGTQEQQPVLTRDFLTVFFGSQGTAGGDFAIRMAKRTARGDPFAKAVDVTELNGPGTRSPSWLSADGCRLYFDSWVGSTPHIYMAARTR